MAAIAGIAGAGHRDDVLGMLRKMSHRGRGPWVVLEDEAYSLGMIHGRAEQSADEAEHGCVRDPVGEHYCTQAFVKDGAVVLQRDPLGVAPLYYGRTADGALCFTSEVKALLEVTRDLRELPPGTIYDGQVTETYYHLQPQAPWIDSPASLAKELRRRLNAAIQRCVHHDTMGAWLSGGLDSSAIVALARPHLKTLHTFVAGLAGAPDLEAARNAADFVKTNHHEVVATANDLLQVLPEVIYHLESFDALLVRSSLTNYLAARAASDHVAEVFSGEGGDELFAGYAYLKALPMETLADELIDITNRLHNTALQRVDRCAAAHGLTAHVCFLMPSVVEFAVRIPVRYKLCRGVEKWIMRQAIKEMLPLRIANRPKARFWEGAGVGDTLAIYADQHISDEELSRQRTLPNGWTLASKEELMYYRIFHDYFGDLPSLDWMGRTKGASPDEDDGDE